MSLEHRFDWQAPSGDSNDEQFGDCIENIALGDGDEFTAVLVGVPYDGAVLGRPGAREGPAAIRDALAALKTHHFDAGPVSSVGDLGTVEIPDGESVSAVQEAVRETAADVHDSDAIPVFLGGDNSLTYANVRPLLDADTAADGGYVTDGGFGRDDEESVGDVEHFDPTGGADEDEDTDKDETTEEDGVAADEDDDEATDEAVEIVERDESADEDVESTEEQDVDSDEGADAESSEDGESESVESDDEDAETAEDESEADEDEVVETDSDDQDETEEVVETEESEIEAKDEDESGVEAEDEDESGVEAEDADEAEVGAGDETEIEEHEDGDEKAVDTDVEEIDTEVEEIGTAESGADSQGETVGVISLDAHLDCREVDGQPTSGTPYRQLFDAGLDALAVLGARHFETSTAYAEFLREQGGDIVTAEEVGDDPVEAADRALATMSDVDSVYLSVDMDVLDVTAGPGVSAPTPGGITTRELFRLVRLLASDDRLAGIEIVETAPQLCPDGRTAEAAGRALAHALASVEASHG